MNISLYLLCHNEEKLIEKTIKYYKNRFNDNIKITILDNYSTDNSCNIALNYNCNIIKWGNKNHIIVHKNAIKNNPHNIYYKNENKNTWIITCDMDEWLDITYNELLMEDKKQTTIIKTKGLQLVSDNINEKYEKCDFYNLDKGFYDIYFDKNIMFKYGPINNINFLAGQHKCNPVGIIKYSNKIYTLYHLNFISLNYYINRHIYFSKRFIEKKNYNYKNTEDIKIRFMNNIKKAKLIKKIRKI